MMNITGNEVIGAVETAGARVSHTIHGYHQGPSPTSGLWKMESDSSLTGYQGMSTCGYDTKGSIELISPILYGAAGVKELNRVLTRINRTGAYANRLCGTHITVGLDNNARWNAMSDTKKIATLDRIARFYNHFQTVFDAISPNYRNALNNNYVGRTRLYSQGATSTKMAGVNFSSFISRGVVEFRQPGYTLNKKVIGLWIKVIQKVMSMALNENHVSRGIALTTMPMTVTGLATYLDMNSSLESKVRARVQLLADKYETGRSSRLAVLATPNTISAEDANEVVNCICCGMPFVARLWGQNICNDEGCF